VTRDQIQQQIRQLTERVDALGRDDLATELAAFAKRAGVDLSQSPPEAKPKPRDPKVVAKEKLEFNRNNPLPPFASDEQKCLRAKENADALQTIHNWSENIDGYGGIPMFGHPRRDPDDAA
jgi:hypothetical protein